MYVNKFTAENAMLRGYIDFNRSPWPSISHSAKDLLKKMLMKDPRKRITAAKALGECRITHHMFCRKTFYCPFLFHCWLVDITA